MSARVMSIGLDGRARRAFLGLVLTGDVGVYLQEVASECDALFGRFINRRAGITNFVLLNQTRGAV